MRRSIGIRVSPSTIFYSIVSYENEELLIEIVDKINNPKALSIPEQLKFIRNTLCDIINQFKISNACIRITESSARSPSIPRIYIEGVIQELFASSTISKYYVGQISSISKNLGIDRENFKPFSNGVKNFLEIDNWDTYILEQRESLMSAISAINI